MKLFRIILTICMYTTALALEIENRSAMPARIIRIITTIHNGIDQTPSIMQAHIVLTQNSTIHYALPVTELSFEYNNRVYNVMPNTINQSGHIIIEKNGSIMSSVSISLTEQEHEYEKNGPMRDKPIEPRMI